MRTKDDGWIGVDLDRTLAHYDTWKGEDHVGPPIPKMLKRVKAWLKEGREVRIFTARVSHDGSAKRMLEAQAALIAIHEWCIEHFDQPLPITCVKDFRMWELWDDRAVRIERNTGVRVSDTSLEDEEDGQ